MNMQDFIDKHGVAMECTRIGTRNDGFMDDMPSGTRHYTCKITTNGKQYTVNYSQGPAITEEPELSNVLDSLASDASAAYGSFGDFAGEFGYDEDSRRAERIYRACVQTRKAIFRLFGDDAETLMYEIERL